MFRESESVSVSESKGDSEREKKYISIFVFAKYIILDIPDFLCRKNNIIKL